MGRRRTPSAVSLASNAEPALTPKRWRNFFGKTIRPDLSSRTFMPFILPYGIKNGISLITLQISLELEGDGFSGHAIFSTTFP
jgi:hypothetical protein